MTHAPPTPRHLECLNQFRGLAILGVFFFHVLGSVYGTHNLAWVEGLRDFRYPPSDSTFFYFYPLSFGWFGVPLFFVISGFCIHLSHVAQKDSWAFFYNRRFWRIYPPMVITLLIFAFGNYFVANSTRSIWGQGTSEAFRQIGLHALLIHNFFPEAIYKIVPAFWTIATESQLYLIYFLLFYLVVRFSWRTALWFTAILEIGTRSLPALFPSEMYSLWQFRLEQAPTTFWFSWALGAFLADQYRQGKIKVVPLAVPGVVILLTVVCSFFQMTDAFTFTLFAVAFYYVVAWAIKREVAGSVPRGIFFRHMSFVGQCSYSFYLIHQPIVRVYSELCNRHTSMHWVAVLGSIVLWFIILGISYLFYHLVEKPSIRLGYRVWAAAGRPAK